MCCRVHATLLQRGGHPHTEHVQGLDAEDGMVNTEEVEDEERRGEGEREEG